jgi:predicted DCC family thiol-disulfide oxidoreductase YuxK
VTDSADVVIFDGGCAFCQSQIGLLRRLDRRGALRFVSAQDPKIATLYPDLDRGDLMRQMYVIRANGQRFAGAEAVRYLTRRLPWLWPAALILHLPGTSGLWNWLYRQIAARRYSLKTGESCPIPPKG